MVIGKISDFKFQISYRSEVVFGSSGMGCADLEFRIRSKKIPSRGKGFALQLNPNRCIMVERINESEGKI
jgi:hypothetical protein